MKLWKKLFAGLLAAVTVLTAACAPSRPETVDSDGTHIVTDHLGNTVEVPNTINRVVVFDIYPLPSIISVFFNSAEKLVGIPKPSMAAAKNSILAELYPEILNAETGYIDGTEVNIEEVLKLRPDVVFYNAGNQASGELLKKAGIPGVAISAGKWQYDAIQTLDGWLETLGAVFGTETVASRVKAYAEEVYGFVQERIGKIPQNEREKVFFLFQYTDVTLQSAGNPSFGSWWANAIGADFVLTETTPQNALPVNMEQIYAWNPSVIFVTNFTTATAGDIYENRIGNDDWSPVNAVKEERVYKMPLGLYRTYTAGADTPIALLWLAKACYPQYFEDVSITERTIAYYREIFGITLTPDQAERIFTPSEKAGVMN